MTPGDQDAGLSRAVIDSIAAQIAVLDPAGTVIAVNGAWRSLGAAAGATEPVGVNYLAVCDAASADGYASAAAAALRSVLYGNQQRAAVEYPCGPGWWILDVTRLEGGGAVVAHTEITARIQAELAVRDSMRHLEIRVEQRTAELRALATQLIRLQEEERSRVARDIHDELGQALTELNLGISDLKWGEDARDLEQRVARLAQLIGRTSQAVQRVAAELRPPILDRLGLLPAIESRLDALRRRSIHATLHVRPEHTDIAGDGATAVYRIVQEALTNVMRHAGATRVRVCLMARPRRVVITIRDNGRGIPRDRVAGRSSLGLLGMRERAHMIGARLRIRGVPGKGTVVRVDIPEEVA